jgi:flagella basal body P-ring formation protein FlgA
MFKLQYILTAIVIGLVSSALAGDINEIIAEKMLAAYQLDPDHYAIEITSNQLKTVQVDPGDLTFRAISQKEPIGPFTILVSITSAGEHFEKGQVRMRIKRYDDVLVAADKIARNELLSAESFESKRMDVTSLREQPVLSIEGILGHRSKRILRKGDILTTGALEPVPDIEVGEEVTIIYSDHWGTVTVPGTVLQTGWAGRKIKVRNKASGRTILARVVDDRSVAVDP